MRASIAICLVAAPGHRHRTHPAWSSTTERPAWAHAFDGSHPVSVRQSAATTSQVWCLRWGVQPRTSTL